MASRVRATQDWRKGYVRPTRDLVAVGGRSAAHAFAVSDAGLRFLTDRFRYVHDGAEHPLAEACSLPGSLATHTVTGAGTRPAGLVVPYRGRHVEGSDLRRQVRRWVADDVAEPSLATAIDSAIDRPEWFDLRDVQVLLLGAGAELGTLRALLGWGATVLAVDLPRPDTWRRILAAGAGTPGVLHVPVPPDAGLASDADLRDVAQVAGADLLTQLPTWPPGSRSPTGISWSATTCTRTVR